MIIFIYVMRSLDLGPGKQEYLWIGLVVPNAIKEISTQKPNMKKKSAGQQIVEKYESEEKPLRAVVPLIAQTSTDLKYYVLLHSKEKLELCGAYTANQREVFFFDEFRAAATSIVNRVASWTELVKSACTHTQIDSHDKAEGRQYKRATESIRLICEPKQSFANDVVSLTAMYAKSRNPNILEMLKHTLESYDPDLRETPLPSNVNLRLFLGETKESFSIEQSQGVVEEVAIIWPELALTAKAVQSLKRGLHLSSVLLEYRLIRGFLAEATAMLECAEKPVGDDSLVNLVKEANERVGRIIGRASMPSTLSIEGDQGGAILTAVQVKLREIAMAGRQYAKDIRDANGDQVIPVTIADCFETMRNAMDVDTARFAFAGASRFAMGEIAAKNEAMEKMIDDLADILGELNT